MAGSKDAHIVEIPVDEEHQQKMITAMNTISAIQHHPLMEISESPGHLLLLKLWQREEDIFGRRISLKETRMDSFRREIFQLCCFFFIFHGFFLTILFTSSVNGEERTCPKWWIPSVLSFSTSLVIIFLVQMKLYRYWKVSRQLVRERNDNRALTRCIQELRMKGSSFDLSKEPQNARRMKSSSVEIKWKPLTWFGLSCLQIHPLRIKNLGFSRIIKHEKRVISDKPPRGGLRASLLEGRRYHRHKFVEVWLLPHLLCLFNCLLPTVLRGWSVLVRSLNRYHTLQQIIFVVSRIDNKDLSSSDGPNKATATTALFLPLYRPHEAITVHSDLKFLILR